MLETVKGAKGGSQSQRQPKVANDTTASKTYARLQYGMSEGEVEGLANGYKSIYLDDTPIENDSGARNFQDVTLDFRSGTNDQTYMEGFESIASETAVGVELKSDTPWVKGVTNLTLDAVIVRVRFGALKQQDPKNGDVSGVVIDYTIEVQTDGGSWELMLDTQMSGKTSANYERTHRIGLPAANNNWLVRVTRKTPNSSSEYVSDKMYIQAITEVVDLKLAYPNTALIGVQYDAETFSNIAKISVDLKGVKIKVPSNYDPVGRTYVGIWDGLFKRAYSNNPAWIYYDLCTNKRYALGNRLTEPMIDKWSLYRLAQYCDQFVPDGKGEQEPRFTCNVYIQSAESAFDILSKLAGLFRAISYWDGNSIVCEADLPQDTMFTYTLANIIDGAMGINYTGTRARDRHNAVKVAWDNPQNRYKTEYVFVRDEAAIARDRGAVKLLELEAWGCTSEGQAQRTGQWALKTEQLETRTVTFKVGLDGYIPLPGKVIELADNLLAGRDNGGRISSVSTDLKQITLDRDDVVCRAGDRLVVNGEDGKAQARVVSSIAGRVVTVVSAFDSVAAQNVWVVDAKDLATMKFRVVSISQDEPHQFTINAIQHNDSKYDAIDHGAFIDDRPISIINPTTQAPVESVTISSEQMVQQGMSVETMVISWPQAKDATKYQVEWRKDNGTWLKLTLTGNNSAEVAGIYAGQYEARVFAISAFDISSLPTYSVLTELKGKQGKPPKLANIHAEGILFGMKLTWLFPAVGALDTAYTEIEVSPDSTSNIAQLGLFAYPTTVHTIQGMQPNLRQYYRGRLIDRIGNVGDWSDWVSGVSSADASDVLDLLNDQISESQLNQDLKEKIERIEVIDGDIADIIQAVQNVENGITQERNERIAGDDQVLNQLTIYKLSNDQKVAAVVEDVDLVMNEQEVQAKKIDGVYAQVNPPLIGSESDLIGNNSGYAGVWSEQSARIEGDLAQSIRTDQVVAQMNQNDALYQQQIKATADAVSANVRLTETLQTTVGENKASIERVSESVDGVYAQEFTKFDVNGHVAGHGAMNDGKVSRFTFNYDSIDFGAPVGVDGIEVRPLMVLQNTPITLPNGTVVPRGMYVEMANIGYVHANRIYADSLSAISADLGTIKVKEANIDDLAVSTLKIKDNAVTVPIGIKLATPIQKNTQRSATAFTGGDAVILDTSNYFGDIISLSLNRSGGKCQISGYVYVDNVCASAWRSNGSTVSNAPKTMYCGVVLYRNGSPIFIGRVASSSETTNDVAVFNGAVQLPTIIDDAYSGNVQYSIRVGWSTSISDAGLMIRPWNTGNASVLTATLSVLELKK
ncbi:host specificity protein J [Acinetobacter bereziniae]|uniref:host specificity protein J n=1 Tax=Acinetobacter bereziniae TaxID=106648 RepID=UPI0021D0A113|nr:phage tail protein [Acinetobacter bereziniae]MCU4599060.1 phage tail protein [Acinetobacter bereziniae]